MSRETKERSWEIVQIKAFTAWLNGYLEKKNLQIQDIQTDLSDGVRLVKFLELLSGKKVNQKYDENPSSRIQKIQNLHIALKFLEKEMDVRLQGIGAEDFADQNLKLILGFFWSLFKKYRIATIKHQDKSSEEGLLLWCKQTTEGYRDVNIENYKTSFHDGMAFIALIDKFLEGNKTIIDYSKFRKDSPSENLTTAFEIAEKKMGIPKLLESQEVADGIVDERSLVLYISLYFHAFVAKQQQKLLEDQKSKIEETVRGLQGSLEERAKMAAELLEENTRLKEEMDTLKRELADVRDKNNYLDERVEVFKQLLEQENLEKEENQKIRTALQTELQSVKEEYSKTKQNLESENQKATQLTEFKISLEEQVNSLQEKVTQITSNFEIETKERRKESEQTQSRNQVELRGLGVLKRNLEEHLEDLKRWQKYLDLEKEANVDFAGEIRPQIISDIAKESFDEQLQYLSKKLEKENVELLQLLKQKEVEAKAKKALEEKKERTSEEN